VSWAAWDGERDAVRGEEVRREGFFTSESASGLVQLPSCHAGHDVDYAWNPKFPHASSTTPGTRG